MFNSFFKKNIKFNFSIIIFLIALFSYPQPTNAATLSLTPGSTSITVGNIVSVNVRVNTSGKYINNAEAIIQFPADLLEVVSISKSSSVFSLWVGEPSFSNSSGIISFNGGVANPGFSGSGGSIASITFRAKKTGTASVFFGDSAVRENDGLGTNILTSKSGTVIQIGAPQSIPTPVVVEEVVVVEEKLDTTPPKPFIPTSRVYNNQNILKLNAEDADSGISYYTIQIDDSPIITVKKAELIDSEYTLPYLYSGGHEIVITAYDKAGNKREANITIVSPFISSPSISLNFSEIVKGETVTISGKTDYVNTKISLVMELEGKEIKRYTQTTSADGSFSITTDKVKDVGLINIWAENVLSDRVKSEPSERIYLTVEEAKVIKVSKIVLYSIMVSVLFLALVVALYIGWHRFFSLRKKINNELKVMVNDAHKATALLKEELDSQLEILEKVREDRALNKKEQEIFKEIKQNVDDIDRFIEKKLKKLM